MAAGIYGCGGGSDTTTPARVSYSDQAAAGTVKDYMDADWLYQNYLGDLGLPPEVKPQLMPAIQMLANGFALQFKRGDDVTTAIKSFDSRLLDYAASGQAVKFFQSMNDQARTVPTQQPSVPSATTGSAVTLPTLTANEAAAVQKALSEDAALLANIQQIAEQYNLPYKITGQDAQWFTYTPTMKGSKGSGSGSAGPSPTGHVNIPYWNWRPGDVIWSNGETGTGIPGHVGLVDAYSLSNLRIIDANTPGVRETRDLVGWANHYTQVRAYTPFLRWNEDEAWNYGQVGVPPDSYYRYSSTWYAGQQLGKPYNWNFVNPRATDSYYCTSLIWAAYNSVGYSIFPVGPYEYKIILPSDLVGRLAMFNSSNR